MPIMCASVETIRPWQKCEAGWHRSPEGIHIKLGNNVRFGNNVTLGDYVILGDGVTLLTQPIHLIGSRHPLVLLSDGRLQIGCMCESIAWWLEHGDEAATEERFSADQVEEYRRYVEMIAALVRNRNENLEYKA